MNDSRINRPIKGGYQINYRKSKKPFEKHKAGRLRAFLIPKIRRKEDMKIEIRADGAHISGYVNATEKKSRPVITPHGKVIEEIEPRAFERAIERAGEITLTVDHDSSSVYARTSDGTLQLYEDDIGLHADVLIRDQMLIELAKTGKIRGWSFGMYNVVDELVERANDLPLRKVKELDLDHVTLVVKKTPVYSATSVEIRAGADVEMEERGREPEELHITVERGPEPQKPFYDKECPMARAIRARANAYKH